MNQDATHRVSWPEAKIASIGAEQRALITIGQLEQLGVRRGSVRAARARGRIHPLHRGVYALVPPNALPPLALEHAAVLACLPDAFLSGYSAAAAWGIRKPPPDETAPEVTVVGREAGRRRPGIVVHRVKSMTRWDTRVLHGLPITSPAMALLDIAARLTQRELEWAFDEVVFARRLASVHDVRMTLGRYPHRRGAGCLKELVVPGRTSTVTRSDGEETVFGLIRRSGLPEPEVNVLIGRYKADFFWRREGVVVELDGFDFHRGRAAFERDHRRDGEHQDADLYVIRITPSMVAQEPELFVARLARALALRGR